MDEEVADLSKRGHGQAVNAVQLAFWVTVLSNSPPSLWSLRRNGAMLSDPLKPF